MNKKIFLIFILLIYSVLIFSQSKQDKQLSYAQYWEKENDYISAAYFYKQYLQENDSCPISLYYRYASLCRQIHHYKTAEYYYEKICLSDSISNYPQAWFWLAMTQKNNAKYEQAQYSIIQYLQIGDDDVYLNQRSKLELEFLGQIETKLKDTLRVRLEKLPKQINTVYTEQHAIEHEEDGIYFLSMRPIYSSTYNNLIGDYFLSQIYLSTYSYKGLREAYPLTGKINSEKYHNGRFCFNREKSRIYFSRCSVKSKELNRWTIWYCDLDENGNFSNPKQMGKQINMDNTSSMDPYLVEYENHSVLYFVSDRNGGLGGKDIWYTIIHDDECETPVNLGSNINTSGDEISPFYHQDSQQIFFSSDFHAGFGGMDIFVSKGSLSSWKRVENVGYPINSPANEVGFVLNTNAQSGYFSSNRKGSLFYSDEGCCNDIYSFDILQDTLKYYIDTLLTIPQEQIVENIQTILPIDLYFHNDEPNPKSMDTTTNIDYKTSLLAYTSMKELYQQEYSKGLKDKEKIKAKEDIENFFIEKLEEGLRLLDQVKQWILVDLQRGNDVEITITGFASPLFSDKYNENLSMRRIISFENYIALQKEFTPYLDDTTSGNKLKFIAIPKGKSTAAKHISDNVNDKRNSVFSISAALERRIQLSKYESKPHLNNSNKGSIMLLASKNINIKKQKNVDVYQYYFEIKNIGDDTLYIDRIISSSPNIKLNMENKIIAPQTHSFLFIEFTYPIFSDEGEKNIIFYAGQQKEIITLNFQQ